MLDTVQVWQMDGKVNDMSQVIPLGPASRMLTTRDAAQRLGVSLRTVQLWVEADILPAARTPGGHRRIPYNAVEALALSTGLGGEPVTRAHMPQANFPAVSDAFVGDGQALDILLVADDPQWQEACAEAVWPLGEAVKLRYAETGYLALLQIGRQTPDVLITYLDLPGMDGMAMLRTLERCEFTRPMHVLLLCQPEDLDLARQAGLPSSVELLGLPVSAQAVAVRAARCLLEQCGS